MTYDIVTHGGPRVRGAASALGERLERFCAVGISHRRRGICVEPGVSAAKHHRLGHDPGCSSLGVPRRAIVFITGVWDRAGAAPLMLEAVDEAIETLTESTADWNAEVASECLAYAIRVRITIAQ